VTTTSRSYDTVVHDDDLDRTLSFAPVDPDRDWSRLHTWLGSDHVKPYWQLDLPAEEFRATLAEKCSADYLTPYVGFLDHVPMSYWETYRAVAEPVGDRYDADPTDRGVHLLIGPPEYLGHGYAGPLLRTITRFLFAETDADRVVGEPDVRNGRAIRVFEQCGYESQGRIDLPEKEALLMHCERGAVSDR
jgi:RimJ/RimL family protein N-acetyltransferase